MYVVMTTESYLRTLQEGVAYHSVGDSNGGRPSAQDLVSAVRHLGRQVCTENNYTVLSKKRRLCL
jgi:hypothetical protein